MKKIFTLMALLALAGCESATSSGQEARADRTAQAPETPHFSGGSAGAAHRAVIASVRKTGSGTYEAMGLAVDGNQVYMEVRSSTTGFGTLTSGTLVTSNWGTGETSVTFSATAGTRYLVAVFPYNGGLVDIVHPTYLEAVP